MQKPDRRTERTRTALMRAFVDLLMTEGYEAVTVERVAERANVGRSTFYMHYAGKETILRQSMMFPSSRLAELICSAVAAETLAPLLLHFQEQRKRNRVFFEHPVRPIWVNCLASMSEPRLTAVARQARSRPLLPLPLVALQIAEAQTSLVVHWLFGNVAAKPEAVADALIATTRAMVAALLACDPSITVAPEKMRAALMAKKSL